MALSDLAGIARIQGRFADALATDQEARNLFLLCGDQPGVAQCDLSLAATALAQGHLAEVESCLERARQMIVTMSHPALADAAQHAQAWHDLATGQITRAAAQFHVQIADAQAAHDSWRVTRALRGLAAALDRQGESHRALAILTDVRQMLHEDTDRAVQEAQIDTALGWAALHADDLDIAIAHWHASLRVAHQALAYPLIVEILDGMAGVLLAQQQPDRAARLLGAAAALTDHLGITRWPVDRPAYEQQITPCRAALGDAAFTEAWAVGQRWTLDEAVAAALEGISA